MEGVAIMKKRNVTIRGVTFRKDGFYLKFNIMDKIFFYREEDFHNKKEEDFSILILNAMRCKSFEQLIGKQAIYYIVKKKDKDKVFLAIEDPNSEGVAYTPRFQKKGLFF